MPKKLGMNSKAEEAKAKKEEAKKGKSAAEQKQKEDQEWRDAGEGAKTKAQAKKDEQVRFPDLLVVVLLRHSFWTFNYAFYSCSRYAFDDQN